ncbi:MAG: hypothetical protein HQL84_13635 [Magnetococcales bacterium]|nr:hypothetical protein [Magnetococcales bacterium]MBF0151076.1 hypothetical protein [Magnetococcales bacterium]
MMVDRMVEFPFIGCTDEKYPYSGSACSPSQKQTMKIGAGTLPKFFDFDLYLNNDEYLGRFRPPNPLLGKLLDNVTIKTL